MTPDPQPTSIQRLGLGCSKPCVEEGCRDIMSDVSRTINAIAINACFAGIRKHGGSTWVGCRKATQSRRGTRISNTMANILLGPHIWLKEVTFVLLSVLHAAGERQAVKSCPRQARTRSHNLQTLSATSRASASPRQHQHQPSKR